MLSCFDGFVSLFHVCESQFWLWTPTKLVNRFFFFHFFLMVVLSKSCLIFMSCLCGPVVAELKASFIGCDS